MSLSCIWEDGLEIIAKDLNHPNSAESNWVAQADAVEEASSSVTETGKGVEAEKGPAKHAAVTTWCDFSFISAGVIY